MPVCRIGVRRAERGELTTRSNQASRLQLARPSPSNVAAEALRRIESVASCYCPPSNPCRTTNSPTTTRSSTRPSPEWRDEHRLREDDAVMLLVELVRIHQRHWDEIRRRELPSFEQFRSDITKLVESAQEIQRQAATLIGVMRTASPNHGMVRVTRTAAIFAALATLLAGYLIGRAWQ